MKLKVEKEFRDKITGVLHKVDDVFEVEKERADELLADSRNLVTLIKEEVKKTTSKTKNKKSGK